MPLEFGQVARGQPEFSYNREMRQSSKYHGLDDETVEAQPRPSIHAGCRRHIVTIENQQ